MLGMGISVYPVQIRKVMLLQSYQLNLSHVHFSEVLDIELNASKMVCFDGFKLRRHKKITSFACGTGCV